jgi:uncharacterized phiE125 gp8 family phage protein
MAIPVSIEDARRQIRLDEDDDSQDADLNISIADAAAWVERYTGHILVARDVVESYYGCSVAQLRAWPVVPDAVASVTYTDGAGATVVAPGVLFDPSRRPVRLTPPRILDGKSYTVTFRAGYEIGDAVPGNFRRAMLILISAYESDREGGDIFHKAEAAAKSLCRDFRARNL